MALLTKRPKGTEDIIPEKSHIWQHVENVLSLNAKQFLCKEIRFPTFEHTELFTRSVGDTTDVVQKEMYTFLDKGKRSVTLKPEGTAGVVRAVIENGLLNSALPLKLYYITPAFRYENKQAGRLREFHQFGCEFFGSPLPIADAELISLAVNAIDALEINNAKLEINSIGCRECRNKFYEALKSYFNKNSDVLCKTCCERLEKNPMRILDCKEQNCIESAENAPVILDFLCGDCNNHFEAVKHYLDVMLINYEINPKIVRGLDYYNRTVFEIISEDIGSQSTICGGGRYDSLVELLGGNPTPALGFAMGIERLIMVMEAQQIEIENDYKCDLYIGSAGEKASKKAIDIAYALRSVGFHIEFDVMGRTIKAQMKYANKINASFSTIIGENELETENVKIKNMESGEDETVPFDKINEFLEKAELDSIKFHLNEFTEGIGKAIFSDLFSGINSNPLSEINNFNFFDDDDFDDDDFDDDDFDDDDFDI